MPFPNLSFFGYEPLFVSILERGSSAASSLAREVSLAPGPLVHLCQNSLQIYANLNLKLQNTSSNIYLFLDFFFTRSSLLLRSPKQQQSTAFSFFQRNAASEYVSSVSTCGSRGRFRVGGATGSDSHAERPVRSRCACRALLASASFTS